ncbi:MAG TPA: HAMP domain-containing sensor histidine kinase [Gemmatimonadaceae bacterium]|nr:HAMP domain-containing sensor histidine kinase [Gemmatimonadaceae bacterium]
MVEFRLPRGVRSRTTSLVAILMLTVALAAFLTYEAWDAARSHRATAKRAIQDYARFAAWEFSVSAKEVLYSTLAWAFSPTGALDAHDLEGPIPGPKILDNPKSSHLLCARDSSRYFFRLDMRDGSFVTSGDVPSGSMRAWMLDTLPKNAKTYKADLVYEVVSGSVDGHPRAIAYQLKRDRAGRPAVAYGFELCLAKFAAQGLSKVMAHYAILPPSLTGGVPNDSVSNDSIFSVKVFDGGGHEIFRSQVQYPSMYTGAYKLDYFGGLKTTIALRPTLAKTLLIGELPSERLPLLLGVLGLSTVLAAIGVMQLRRESELARLRSDFIASVSHELRTPLAQVRMFAETLLLGRVRSDDERLRSLQIVDQEARRLTHLVENILQFSRAEREAIRLAPVPSELGSQVREAIEAFAPVARSRHVQVQTALDPDVVCMVDPGALRQILLNLLDNAVKYGPLGQTVTITLRRVGDRARVIVDDQGPGVPSEHRTRIWEPYQRLDSAVVDAVAGSGIGLAVVAQLVELHGGRAWTEGAPGRGARFVVELPYSGNREPGTGNGGRNGANGSGREAERTNGVSAPSVPSSQFPVPKQ